MVVDKDRAKCIWFGVDDYHIYRITEIHMHDRFSECCTVEVFDFHVQGKLSTELETILSAWRVGRW